MPMLAIRQQFEHVSVKNPWKIIQNRSKIDPKSIPDWWKCALGSFWVRRSHPCRLQDARSSSGDSAFGCFLVEIVSPTVVFGVPLGSNIAPKSHGCARVGTLSLQKCPLGGDAEKTWKSNDESVEISIVFKVWNHEKHCKIHCFFDVQRSRIMSTNCQKMSPGRRPFWAKIDTWASQSHLGGGFGTFLGDIEKSKFFDVALGCNKINKIWSLDARGLKKGLRHFSGGHYQRSKYRSINL